MKLRILVSILAVSALMGSIWTSTASAATNGTMFVVGDSITARYNNTTGSSNQGWWSMVAHDLHLTPHTSAVSGTGFLNKMPNCKTGFNYSDRLRSNKVDAEIKAAKVVIIEGGRNDYRRCDAANRTIHTTPTEVRTAANQYFDAIRRVHKDPRDIYVMTPWGPHLSEYDWIIPIVRSAALQHDFHWISTTGVLTSQNTVDGTHPNHAGNVALASRVIDRDSIFSHARH